MNKVLPILIIVMICSCTSNSDYVIQNEWKFGEGYHIDDWLNFGESEIYKISNDTIFKQDKAVAIILWDEKNSCKTELTLKSLGTGELGTYHKK